MSGTDTRGWVRSGKPRSFLRALHFQCDHGNSQLLASYMPTRPVVGGEQLVLLTPVILTDLPRVNGKTTFVVQRAHRQAIPFVKPVDAADGVQIPGVVVHDHKVSIGDDRVILQLFNDEELFLPVSVKVEVGLDTVSQ